MQIAEGRIFQFIPTRGHSVCFPERECIGNYTPNSWVVLTIDNFNTLLLYKEKNDIDSVLQDLFTLSEKGEQVDVYFSRISSCRSGSAVSCVWLAHGV